MFLSFYPFLSYFLILFLFNAQGKEVNLFQPASEFLPMIDEVCKCLQSAILQALDLFLSVLMQDSHSPQVFNSLVNSTKEIKGAKVENNKFCVSVHYRNVDEKVKYFSSVLEAFIYLLVIILNNVHIFLT